MIDLYDELSALVDRLHAAHIEYALCGGLAVAVYAYPRATVDIDIMIEPQSLDSAKRIANDLGYTTDAGLMRFKVGAIQIHRRTKLLKSSTFPLVLDFVLVTPQIQDVWNERQVVPWSERSISVVSAKGLIHMKRLRNNEQDQADIAQLRKNLDED